MNLRRVARSLIKRLPVGPRLLGYRDTNTRLRQFRRDFETFQHRQALGPRHMVASWADRLPCLDDRTPLTGYDRHYVYHTAWAARILAQTRPASHTDISSCLHFVAMVSAFVPVRFYDYRPALLELPNLTCGQADLCNLPFPSGSIPSLSCMHVVEHIGLGRYGDPLDPDGDLRAVAELTRVLAPGGSLLFVVPVGSPRICFNAHRIYSYEQVIQAFPALTLRQFALIPDSPSAGGLIENASAGLASQQRYGCGCFWLAR